MGAPLPKEPIMFLKPTSSLSGPNDEVMLPRGIIPKKGKTAQRLVDSKRSDWEVELGIVIGDKARSVTESKALQYIGHFSFIRGRRKVAKLISQNSRWSMVAVARGEPTVYAADAKQSNAILWNDKQRIGVTKNKKEKKKKNNKKKKQKKLLKNRKRKIDTYFLFIDSKNSALVL